MLSQILSGDKDSLIFLLLSIPTILFSLSFHEASHGFIANKMGDPTAKNLGRITLNPIKHLDLMGALCMLVFGYGWAKPVPIVTRNFDNPRKGMAITGIAGPVSNFILGVISCIFYVISQTVYRLIYNARLDAFISGASDLGTLNFSEFEMNIAGETLLMITGIFINFFFIGAILNFGLMVFNLIPVPPFDGSRFFYYFLPSKWYFKVMQYENKIMLIVLIGFFALSRVGLSPVSNASSWLFTSITDPLMKLSENLFFS